MEEDIEEVNQKIIYQTIPTLYGEYIVSLFDNLDIAAKYVEKHPKVLDNKNIAKLIQILKPHDKKHFYTELISQHVEKNFLCPIFDEVHRTWVTPILLQSDKYTFLCHNKNYGVYITKKAPLFQDPKCIDTLLNDELTEHHLMLKGFREVTSSEDNTFDNILKKFADSTAQHKETIALQERIKAMQEEIKKTQNPEQLKDSRQ